MEEPDYIGDVQAWLTTDEVKVAAPVPSITDEVTLRLCRGCGEPLPDKRKGFHNNTCRGAWLSRRSPTVLKAAKAKEANA